MRARLITMFDIDKALKQEITYCESFTNKTTTEFGIIYYNHLNPLSHDSNHAHILNIEHADTAILEIKRFYTNLQLRPSLYPSFIDNEFEILKPHLEAGGFTVDKHENTWMLFPKEVAPLVDSTTSVRKITRVSEDIIEIIHSNENGDWTIKVLETHTKDERFHLLGLFNSEKKCISIASVNTMYGYSRVDDVVTHMDYRGQHFGTKLINYLVSYHANISKNYLYLWAHNPIAIRMYKRVGFKEISMNKPGWAAYIK